MDVGELMNADANRNADLGARVRGRMGVWENGGVGEQRFTADEVPVTWRGAKIDDRDWFSILPAFAIPYPICRRSPELDDGDAGAALVPLGIAEAGDVRAAG